MERAAKPETIAKAVRAFQLAARKPNEEATRTLEDATRVAQDIYETETGHPLSQGIDAYLNNLARKAKRLAKSSRTKSNISRILDRIIKFITILMGIAIGILGIYSGGNASSTLALVSGILGFVLAGLISLRDQFAFQARSVVLRDCYHQAQTVHQSIINAKYMGLTDIELLTKCQLLFKQLINIDMSVFNSEIIKVAVEPVVDRPEDII